PRQTSRPHRGSRSPRPATHRRSPADCRSAPSGTRRSGETSRPRPAPCSSALPSSSHHPARHARKAGTTRPPPLIPVNPARGHLAPPPIAPTGTVGEVAATFAFLPLEPLDPFAEFLQRDLELGRLPVPDIIEVKHLAPFLEREADRLASEHVG